MKLKLLGILYGLAGCIIFGAMAGLVFMNYPVLSFILIKIRINDRISLVVLNPHALIQIKF